MKIKIINVIFENETLLSFLLISKVKQVKQVFNGNTSHELNDIVVTSTDVLNKIMKLITR